MKARPCPACREPMSAERFAGNYGREVELDICHRCNALWFDHLENVALSAGGILALLRSMHERETGERQPLPERTLCPECQGRLRPSWRMAPPSRYLVHACVQKHGHFISFFDLLREKGAIRPLSGEKLKALRAQVDVVSCSSCGAPVDLRTCAACAHCKAPLALLDPDALRETLERLAAEHERKSNPDGEQLAAEVLMQRLRTERTFRQHEAIERRRGSGGVDLLMDGLAALARWW